MATHSDIQPQSKFFVSQGLQLHYLDWGNPQAPTLILQHGMHDHAHAWDWVARALCRDWHVMAVDLRGHGDSQWSPDGAYHTPYYLLDLSNLIESLNTESVAIIAHSLGGNPSARFAALYPDRVDKLVLVDAMGPSAMAIENWDRQGNVNRTREWLERHAAANNKTPRRFDTVDAAVERMMKAHSYLTEDQARHLTEHGLRREGEQYSWKYDPRAALFHPEDFAIHLSEYWREITASTLICWGPGSWTSNPSEDGNAGYFRDHQIHTFEGAGHWLHHDQPDTFVEVVSAFLST